MAYLIDVYYAQYKVHGMKVPEEVLKFTIEYQKMFDMYSEFISRVIVETGIMTDSATLSELHEEFKNWFLEAYNSPKVPTKHEFRQYMEKTYGKKRVTPTEVKGIKTKMKIEEEKRKREAEEKAQKIKDGDLPDDEEGMIEDEDAYADDPEMMALIRQKKREAMIAKASADPVILSLPEATFDDYDDEEAELEAEFQRAANGGSGASRYFSSSSSSGSSASAPGMMVSRSGGPGVTTTTTTTSYVNGKLVSSSTSGGAANPFVNFPGQQGALIPGMPGGGDPFANFPKPPMMGQSQNITTNNEYNIKSMDDLEKLKIPGMDIHDNPVLKAIFTKDLKAIDELRRVEYKQTGPTSYQLPTITLPPEKKVETYVDEHGNRTTTTTINTTNNIPTINFDGLPEGFTGNPFKLLADKMEEKILRRRRAENPMHSIAAAMLAAILAKKVSEEEEKRRKLREERGEPEPSEEEKIRQMEEDEEKVRAMLESGELDVDIQPDHPMIQAFGSMMKDMMKQEIEHKVRNDPNIPPEKVEEVLKDIYDEMERDELDKANMPSTAIMMKRRPESPPNYFRRRMLMDDAALEQEAKYLKQIRENREALAKKRAENPNYEEEIDEDEREYLEYLRREGREPVPMSDEELAFEMARADAIEAEAEREVMRMQEMRARQEKMRIEAQAQAQTRTPAPLPTSAAPVVVEEVVEEEKKKPAKKKVTVTVKKNKE